MSTRVAFLAIALTIVLSPWLLWRLAAVRRVAPLAVVQILIGVLLGPSALGRAAPELHAALFTRPVLAAVDGVAMIGVLLYVFVTGLHLDLGVLRREARGIGAIAAGSIAVPLLFGAAAGAWMLDTLPEAQGAHGSAAGFVAAVAICVAVTALPVLAAVLGELGLLESRIGQTALAAAALNDAALWVMLAVLLAVGRSDHAARGLLGLGGAVLWYAGLIGVARPLLARLGAAGRQTVLVAGVAVAVASAAVSEALGTGYLIGAFVAGAILPPSCRAELVGRLELVTATVLLPFFFMSTGLKALIEPGSARFLGLLGAAVAATVAGKLIGAAIPARRAGFCWSDSVALGAMMQTKGLMEVVVLVVLQEAGLISGEIFSAMVAMAVVCTVLTAPAVRLARRPGRRQQQPAAS